MNKAKLYSALAMKEMHVNYFLKRVKRTWTENFLKVPIIAGLEESKNSTLKKLRL